MHLKTFMEEMKKQEFKVRTLFNSHPKPSEEQLKIIKKNKKRKEEGKRVLMNDLIKDVHMPGSDPNCSYCISLNEAFKEATLFEQKNLGISRYQEKTFEREIALITNVVRMMVEENLNIVEKAEIQETKTEIQEDEEGDIDGRIV